MYGTILAVLSNRGDSTKKAHPYSIGTPQQQSNMEMSLSCRLFGNIIDYSILNGIRNLYSESALFIENGLISPT